MVVSSVDPDIHLCPHLLAAAVGTLVAADILAEDAVPTIAAFSALFVFLKLLSVLSNSVSAGIRSDPCFLCIKGFPVIKTPSD